MLLSPDGEDGAIACPCIFLFPLPALERVACFLLGDCTFWSEVLTEKHGEESKQIFDGSVGMRVGSGVCVCVCICGGGGNASFTGDLAPLEGGL